MTANNKSIFPQKINLTKKNHNNSKKDALLLAAWGFRYYYNDDTVLSHIFSSSTKNMHTYLWKRQLPSLIMRNTKIVENFTVLIQPVIVAG